MNAGSSLTAALMSLAAACAAGAARGDSMDINVDIAQGPPPALHPTSIAGFYKDQPYRVVGVRGRTAVIDRDGKQVRLPDSATYETDRASGFLPGAIAVEAQSASSNRTDIVVKFPNGSQVSGAIAHEGSDYESTVVASRDFAECYVVLVFFDVGYLSGDTDDPGLAVAFQSIGDLRGGVATKVKADFGYVDFSKRKLFYLPLYFSHGVEIRTNFADESARLFRRVEMIRHERILERYRQSNPKATLEAAPYFRFSPILPENADLSAIPELVRVDFAVTTDGTVEDVTFSEKLPPGVAAAIRRALGGWLFTPKLVNGLPFGSNVALNLRFGKAKPDAGARPAANAAP